MTKPVLIVYNQRTDCYITLQLKTPGKRHKRKTVVASGVPGGSQKLPHNIISHAGNAAR